MTNRYYKLEDTVRFGVTIHNPSGGALINADETPRWYVYEDNIDTPVLTDLFKARTGLIGTYKGNFNASGVTGFESGKYYEIHGSGKVNGTVGRAILQSFVLDDVYDTNTVQVSGNPITSIGNEVWDANLTDHNIVGTFGETLQPIYYANIKFLKDAPNNADEITAGWFKDSVPLTSGDLSDPALSVINTGNGNKVVDSQSMSFINSTSAVVRYNESPSVMVSGEPYVISCSGLIDGTTRNWKLLVGLDDF